jgi:hypothetical protein
MRFSSTHAPPMAISASCNSAHCSIDLAAAHFAAGPLRSMTSTSAPLGAGTTAPVGSAAALLA